MKIYAPVENATGVWCSVYFKNGVGETKNPHLIEWFKSHGYRVEEDVKVEKVNKVEEVVTKVVADSTEPDFEAMTPLELREWMKANGYGSKIKNIRNKEKLIEIIRG
jgi:hypothetical protein